MSQPGLFITLEGGEGAGKTTLAKALAKRLSEMGHTVIVTREPGGTENAEALRTLLVEGETDRWSALAETLILYAARTDHIERLIKPALERGDIVICDRFTDSTKAYQGAAGGLDGDRIKAIDEAVLDGFTPDLTLIVDLDPEVGLARTKTRGEDETRFEKQLISFHKALRQAFLDYAKSDSQRYGIVDGSMPADQVAETAMSVIKDRLGSRL